MAALIFIFAFVSLGVACTRCGVEEPFDKGWSRMGMDKRENSFSFGFGITVFLYTLAVIPLFCVQYCF